MRTMLFAIVNFSKNYFKLKFCVYLSVKNKTLLKHLLDFKRNIEVKSIILIVISVLLIKCI